MTKTSSKARAIIKISTSGKKDSRINYSRRMYAIIRRYTPDVVESNTNECYADLTGLRTFFKMTYAEIAEEIKKSLTKEIGVKFTLNIASSESFKKVKSKSKKSESFSTYKEINSLFVNSVFNKNQNRKIINIENRKIKFTVPFIGKVY